jgi:hypothetical protein
MTPISLLKEELAQRFAAEYRARINMRQQMVGSLYPSILNDEMNLIEEMCKAVCGEHPLHVKLKERAYNV